MIKRINRDTDSFSVSFLDVASCGFGAMIILLMITKSSTSTTLEIVEDIVPEGAVAELQEQLFEIRGETTILNRELNAKHEQLSAMTERIARLRRDLEDIEGRYNTTKDLSDETTDEIGQLALAQQMLTAEMQRILENSEAPEESPVFGVPVDSEYFIFVIDTSPSMFNSPNWDKMISVIQDTLDIYPEVKGIQVMNDMGDYMFQAFRGQWIEDSPLRRSQIVSRLRTWTSFSNSSPVEGIAAAINTFYDKDKNISIYVLGDDFFGGGRVSTVLNTIDKINVENENGDRLVRIHGIAFDSIFDTVPPHLWGSVYRYGNLMRELARRNGGTFIAF